MGFPNWTVQYEVERWIKETVDDPVKQAVMLGAYYAGRQHYRRVLQSRFGHQVAVYIESGLDDESMLDALVIAGAWAGMLESVLP